MFCKAIRQIRFRFKKNQWLWTSHFKRPISFQKKANKQCEFRFCLKLLVKIGKLALKHRHQTSLLKHSFEFANNVISRISLKRCHLISICSWISWPWVNHLDLKWPSLPRGVYNACLLIFLTPLLEYYETHKTKKKPTISLLSNYFKTVKHIRLDR